MTLPSLRNSAKMRRAPQRRWFLFISITSWRTPSWVAHRPIGFCLNVHWRAASFRYEASTVLGLIVTMLSTTPLPNRNRDMFSIPLIGCLTSVTIVDAIGVKVMLKHTKLHYKCLSRDSPMAKKNIKSVALNERLKPAKIYLRQRERPALRSMIFDGQP
jgi:hypothetical protein